VQLIKNGKKIAAFVPRDGCLNFVDENVSTVCVGIVVVVWSCLLDYRNIGLCVNYWLLSCATGRGVDRRIR
jgi:hypothetical protein